MRILVLNCGSSSVKFAVIDTENKESLSSGLVENIGVNGHFKAKGPEGKAEFHFDCPTHKEAVVEVQKFLTAQKLSTLSKLLAIASFTVENTSSPNP